MFNNCTFEGGPRKRESAGDARRRVRKIFAIFLFEAFSQHWLRTFQPSLYRYSRFNARACFKLVGESRGWVGWHWNTCDVSRNPQPHPQMLRAVGNLRYFLTSGADILTVPAEGMTGKTPEVSSDKRKTRMLLRHRSLQELLSKLTKIWRGRKKKT